MRFWELCLWTPCAAKPLTYIWTHIQYPTAPGSTALLLVLFCIFFHICIHIYIVQICISHDDQDLKKPPGQCFSLFFTSASASVRKMLGVDDPITLEVVVSTINSTRAATSLGPDGVTLQDTKAIDMKHIQWGLQRQAVLWPCPDQLGKWKGYFNTKSCHAGNCRIFDSLESPPSCLDCMIRL